MKFINEFSENLKTKQSTKLFLDIKGEEIDNEQDAYAKLTSIDLGGGKIQKKFFIRTYNNIPLDPIGPESRRNIWERTQLKVVSKETFDHYANYLKTRNGVFLTKAQRSFING